MSKQTKLVFMSIPQPRGVLNVMYAGTFTTAKAWAKKHYEGLPIRYKETHWKHPQEIAFEFEKMTGKQVEADPAGPLAFWFVRNPHDVHQPRS